MNTYKQNGKPNWYFAICLNAEAGGRKQNVVNTYATDRRVANEVLRKTQLLAESVDAAMPLTGELRKWLEQMPLKLRKRLATIGLLDTQADATARSVIQHVEDYLEDCRFQGKGKSFENIKRSQLNRAMQGTRAKRLTDLNRERVTIFLRELRDKPLRARTVNQNRSTLVGFLNWCVDHDRLPSHQLDRIPRLPEESDRSLVRRAATDDEIERLLAVVPPDRAIKYQTALFTGLRRSELRLLEVRDLDLLGGMLTVRAGIGKSKKADLLPLHDDLRVLLRKYIQKMRPQDLLFDSIPHIETFQLDLKRAGIAYRDENGRQLDFHALRGTFATRLLRQGVPPSVARRLTRHASVVTLEKHYDKLGLADAVKAMKKLPSV